jgi:hypothetical protein
VQLVPLVGSLIAYKPARFVKNDAAPGKIMTERWLTMIFVFDLTSFLLGAMAASAFILGVSAIGNLLKGS